MFPNLGDIALFVFGQSVRTTTTYGEWLRPRDRAVDVQRALVPLLPRACLRVSPQRGLPRVETAADRPIAHSSNFQCPSFVDSAFVERSSAESPPGLREGAMLREAAHSAAHRRCEYGRRRRLSPTAPKRGANRLGMAFCTSSRARVHCFSYFAFTSSPVRGMCLIHSALRVKAAGRFPSPVKC